jgi:hypothetical protein
MLVFPQLSTGASGIYPITKTMRQRSVVNTLGDGSTNVYSDPEAKCVGWELHASGLTATERGAIEALFQVTSGRWRSFTFLDPTGNLMLDSENFGASAWTNGALIHLTTGTPDPFGTTRATSVTNAGLGTEAVGQTLPVPGNFHYCLSVWARTASGTSVTLAITTTGGSAAKTFTLGTQWKRISISANLARTTDSVTFAAQLTAGGEIDLFGMQAEAQLGCSDYKQTRTRSGVYGNARFDIDEITVTAQGTDVYDAVLRIVNTEN